MKSLIDNTANPKKTISEENPPLYTNSAIFGGCTSCILEIEAYYIIDEIFCMMSCIMGIILAMTAESGVVSHTKNRLICTYGCVINRSMRYLSRGIG